MIAKLEAVNKALALENVERIGPKTPSEKAKRGSGCCSIPLPTGSMRWINLERPSFVIRHLGRCLDSRGKKTRLVKSYTT